MKTTFALVALMSTAASAFSPAPAFASSISSTTLSMFGGGGDGAMKEDADPEERLAIETAAKSMGMSPAEYQLGLNARTKFETAIGDLRYTAGNDDIKIEVDAKSPPTHLVITITDAGKAKGKEALSTELKAAFKQTSNDSRAGRQAAQNDMMKFIQESMK